MNAGRMDKLLSIVESISTARSTDGAPILTISTLSSNIWAEFKPVTGRETFINEAIRYEADAVITMRYSSFVNEVRQIKYNSNFYDIKKFINFYDKNVDIQMLVRMVR
jgi:SPP1 family predicted phage head-tail adaptor